MLQIQIIFADAPEHYWAESLVVAQGISLAQAINSSSFSEKFPHLSLADLGLGVYGIKHNADKLVEDGDRIEIYRGLTFDPKVSRKRRAIHRKAGILKKKHLKPDRSKRIEYDEHTEETK